MIESGVNNVINRPNPFYIPALSQNNNNPNIENRNNISQNNNNNNIITIRL